MEKLLHERLRELKGTTANEIREREEVIHSDELLDKWADEIEKYYIPRPRFDDGEPVVRGSESYGKTVGTVEVRDDGLWWLYDEDGVEFYCGGEGDFAKREPDSLQKLRDDIDCYMRDCALDTDTIDEFERRFNVLLEERI